METKESWTPESLRAPSPTGKSRIKLVIVYLVSLLVGTLIFIVSLWLPFTCLRNIDILFFKAVILLLITCFIILFVLILLKIKFSISFFQYRDVIIIFLCLFFFNFNLYGEIPFNFSRSNSVIMMEYLYKNNQIAKSEEEIEGYITKKYFKEYKAVQIRLSEQMRSGNITKTPEGYTITKKGIKIMNIMSFITGLYNVENDFSK